MLNTFSRAGLTRIFHAAEQSTSLTETARNITTQRERYLSTIETVIRFLQGRDHSSAYRLCHPGFLPRFDTITILGDDRSSARYVASWTDDIQHITIGRFMKRRLFAARHRQSR